MRLLGFIPLTFFLLHWNYHASMGHPENILWLCNLNNLVLAIGFVFQLPLLIQIGIIWLLPAFPLWLIDCYRLNDWPLTSILCHAGALIFGLCMLPQVRMNRRAWIPALVYAFGVQQICRWFTPPDQNVNVAFSIFPGWESIFPHYWEFWVFVLLESCVGIYLITFFLAKKFPEREKGSRAGLIETS